jgi:hypothetical protein
VKHILIRAAFSLLVLVVPATAAKASAEAECREAIEALRAELRTNPARAGWKKMATIIRAAERQLATGEYARCATMFGEAREARDVLGR